MYLVLRSGTRHPREGACTTAKCLISRMSKVRWLWGLEVCPVAVLLLPRARPYFLPKYRFTVCPTSLKLATPWSPMGWLIVGGELWDKAVHIRMICEHRFRWAEACAAGRFGQIPFSCRSGPSPLTKNGPIFPQQPSAEAYVIGDR